MLELFEGIGIAKEACHVDQNIIEERLDFFRILAQGPHVLFETLDLFEKHPPIDPAFDRAGFVVAEIDAGHVSQYCQDPLESFSGRSRLGRPALLVCRKNPDVFGNVFQLAGNLIGR